jgi:hypothetical protein
VTFADPAVHARVDEVEVEVVGIDHVQLREDRMVVGDGGDAVLVEALGVDEPEERSFFSGPPRLNPNCFRAKKGSGLPASRLSPG